MERIGHAEERATFQRENYGKEDKRTTMAEAKKRVKKSAGPATGASELVQVVTENLGTPKPKGRLKAVTPRRPMAGPVSDDPKEELRRLVADHKSLTKKAIAILNMTIEKTSRTTGEPIPSRVPDDRKVEMKAVADALKRDAERLEREMLRELKKLPIYNLFLAKVFGVGVVVSSYLIAMIDPMRVERNDFALRHGMRPGERPTDDEVRAALARGEPLRATKISNFRRFCGLAVIDGRLERPRRGQKLPYCGELRTRLFQAFSFQALMNVKSPTVANAGRNVLFEHVARPVSDRPLIESDSA